MLKLYVALWNKSFNYFNLTPALKHYLNKMRLYRLRDVIIWH